MSKPTNNRVPTYRLHKANRRVVITLPMQGLGRSHDVLLGCNGSPESKQKYVGELARR